METLSKKTVKRARYNIWYIIGFSLAFMIAGYVLPKAYYEFYDGTTYWHVVGAVATDQPIYTKGETPRLSFYRESKVSTVGGLNSELVCVTGENFRVIDGYYREGVKYTIGSQEIQVDAPISDAAWTIVEEDFNGTTSCFFERTVLFEIRGTKREYKYKSNRFILSVEPIFKGGEQL